ncbi:hypothetical protein [Natronomonas amylolytica]|uniref:hypothetical protein n=1 Tax=Natronomonas amylolytica TaxID=3108498 RepID=UPI00300B11FC
MTHVLNIHTSTLHKPVDEEETGLAVCGSLRGVPQARTQFVSEAELETYDGVARCGNCFEGTGGY